MKDRKEYRINKKGAECFRTSCYEEAKEKLNMLNAKRSIYTMQSRSCSMNRLGMLNTDPSGKPLWSCWS